MLSNHGPHAPYTTIAVCVWFSQSLIKIVSSHCVVYSVYACQSGTHVMHDDIVAVAEITFLHWILSFQHFPHAFNQ